MVLPGAKPGMFFAIASYIKPGDEVILSDPGFYSYDNVTRYAGGNPSSYLLKKKTSSG